MVENNLLGGGGGNKGERLQDAFHSMEMLRPNFRAASQQHKARCRAALELQLL